MKTKNKLSFDEIYEKVKSALSLEIKYQYIDFDGRKMNFSRFMLNTLYDILNRIHKSEKQNISTLITLYDSYHVDSLQNRKYTIDKTIDIFTHLKKIIKSKKAAAEEVKEFQETIDDTDIAYIKGVGPQLSKIFNKMGIFKVRDLLEYYPRKYADYQGRSKIRDLKLGEQVTILGVIDKTYSRTTASGLSIITIHIKDSTGTLPINFFLKTKSRRLIEHYKESYPVGSLCMALGKVKFDEYSAKTTLDKAQIQVLGQGEDINLSGEEDLNRIVPIYPLSENLNSKTLINAINNAFSKFWDKIYDPLPDYLLKEMNLIAKRDAQINMHKPKNQAEIDASRFRLVFEEFFSMQLNLALLRKEEEKNQTIRLEIKKDGLVEKFLANLPFELTQAQKTALDEILKDLNSPTPMQRLLQGDVGSGKTVVACAMILCAIENGYQAAIMAPTEILASQHFKNFSSWLTPLGLSCALFTGSLGAKTKRELKQNLLNGQIHVAIGTHALIQEGIEFNNLGAIVIDEQHRFGVKQRNALLNKGAKDKTKLPQMLNMTATPIPRTLALTLHGDLDISIINELPKGRKPIITTLGGAAERNRIYELIKKEIFFKHQAYIVYPLIEESETLSAKAATLEAKKLSEGVFEGYRVGLLHGKMDNTQKDKVMDDFIKGKYDILVSTTVVEVGLDNPNATVIVIENAERFGLSQLHQLRGRVGRSENQSYCALITQSASNEVRNRLKIMTQTNDGFIISQKDLEIRGPGEFLGTRQSGLPDFNLANLATDGEILELARKAAFDFSNKYDIKDYPYLKNEVEKYNLFRG